MTTVEAQSLELFIIQKGQRRNQASLLSATMASLIAQLMIALHRVQGFNFR